MSLTKTIPLSTGASIPRIGLGTYKLNSQVEEALGIAFKNGYRHLDLAHIYGNQAQIGTALKELIPSVVKREELFITSKLWNVSHQPVEVEKELDVTLKDLQVGVDYLDLYLMHWPVAFVSGHGIFPLNEENSQAELDLNTSLVDTWKGMIKLAKTGKVRAIGVSNFTIEQIEGIVAATGVIPAVNQIEAHPLLPQDELVAYCARMNIHITAYSALGNNSVGAPLLTEHPIVKEVATKLGATEAQVLIAWGLYRGYSVIPKSSREGRIISNIKEIELTEEDYQRISSIKGTKYTRYNIPYRFKPRWDICVFGEPEESEASNKPLIG